MLKPPQACPAMETLAQETQTVPQTAAYKEFAQLAITWELKQLEFSVMDSHAQSMETASLTHALINFVLPAATKALQEQGCTVTALTALLMLTVPLAPVFKVCVLFVML